MVSGSRDFPVSVNFFGLNLFWFVQTYLSLHGRMSRCHVAHASIYRVFFHCSWIFLHIIAPSSGLVVMIAGFVVADPIDSTNHHVATSHKSNFLGIIFVSLTLFYTSSLIFSLSYSALFSAGPLSITLFSILRIVCIQYTPLSFSLYFLYLHLYCCCVSRLHFPYFLLPYPQHRPFRIMSMCISTLCIASMPLCVHTSWLVCV